MLSRKQGKIEAFSLVASDYCFPVLFYHALNTLKWKFDNEWQTSQGGVPLVSKAECVCINFNTHPNSHNLKYL